MCVFGGSAGGDTSLVDGLFVMSILCVLTPSRLRLARRFWRVGVFGGSVGGDTSLVDGLFVISILRLLTTSRLRSARRSMRRNCMSKQLPMEMTRYTTSVSLQSISFRPVDYCQQMAYHSTTSNEIMTPPSSSCLYWTHISFSEFVGTRPTKTIASLPPANENGDSQ